MSLQTVLSVSGLPGLFRMIANKNNGLLVEDIITKKVHFASARKHNFTPLETIAIYTVEDSTPLFDVFKKMEEKYETNPPVEAQTSSPELRAYFKTILPDYDNLKVSDKDIRKVIKWFILLKEQDMLDFGSAAEEEKEESGSTEEEKGSSGEE